MIDNTQARPVRRRPSIHQTATVLCLALVVAACGKKEEATATATAPVAEQAAPAVTAETAVSTKVAGMSVDALREAASKAYTENRLYAPAGDNAMEYYLALRDKLPGDAAVSSALVDLLPMTVIAIEQSVNREDFAEAQRLAALLEKADASHPALARLKDSVATRQAEVAKRTEQQALTAEEQAKKQAELEKQRLADQKQQQEEAAKRLAAQQATEREAAQRREADQRAAEQRAAEQREADQRAAQQRAAQQAAATATTASTAGTELRALSTPAPRFPPEAMRAGQSGEVQVEFTVGTDGTVTAVRVVRANPPRVFDREAMNAVRRWRFQPVPAPVTTRRTIGFDPGQ